jgi:DNA-binding transcriptional ArsR family regulator
VNVVSRSAVALGRNSVSELAEPFPLTLAAVGQHVQVLERCGLVRTAKVGRRRVCALDLSGIEAASRWLDQRRTMWERRLDRLEDVLDADPSTNKEQAA